MSTATTIPVDSITIPRSYHVLCETWYGGQYCKLYAICSTGGLTTGIHCPFFCDDDPEKWYLSIWRDLASDVCHAVRAAFRGLNAPDDGGDGEGHDADYPVLVSFETWTDRVVARLEESYGLSDWGRSL